MNELAQTNESNLPANPADLIKGLTNVKDAVSHVQDGMPILKMNGKNGIWTYGMEKIAVEPGQLWAIDPYSFQHGYICWENMEPIGEIMRAMAEPLPAKDELPDYGKEWDLQNTVIMKCMSGEETGMVCINKGSSLGHAKMIRELTSQIITQAESGTDALYPIVDLGYDSYVNRKQGAEIFNPVMDIVDWKTYDEVMGDDIEPMESLALDDQSEPEPEPTPEPETQQRQRRRVASAAKDQPGKTRTRRRNA